MFFVFILIKKSNFPVFVSFATLLLFVIDSNVEPNDQVGSASPKAKRRHARPLDLDSSDGDTDGDDDKKEERVEDDTPVSNPVEAVVPLSDEPQNLGNTSKVN